MVGGGSPCNEIELDDNSKVYGVTVISSVYT